MDTETIFKHYIVCALWSSIDDEGEPLDSVYSSDDLSAETLERMRSDVSEFVQSNKAALRESGLSDEQIGHDFWLTRNGHGTGFWDRGIGSLGDALTRAAKHSGSADLYIGDDGNIHQF